MDAGAKPAHQLSEAPFPAQASPTSHPADLDHLNDLQLLCQVAHFQYDALPHHDSIRLVKVCSVDPEIKCDIKTAALSEYPRYEALSYCWGLPGKLISIICNDSLFEISSSLREGLEQLYHYSQPSGTTWFWIDQICINQEDGIERTQQVRLMNTIYRQSIRTVIWLPSDDETAMATKSLILDVCKALEARGEISLEGGIDEHNSVEAEYPGSAALLPERDDERWQALDRFLDLPWFKRIWVIQEVVLSTLSPIMLCGPQRLYYSTFQRTVRWIYIHPLEVGYLGRAHAVDRMGHIGERDVWEDGTDEITWDIQGLLQLTYWFRATDPRDKIFALLGLCKDTRDPERWPIELNPDYEKPLQQIFANATRYCMKQTQNLNILHLVTSNTEDDGFPSWVPRWDDPAETWTSTGTHTIWIYPTFKTLKDKFNDASAGMQPTIGDTTAPEILRLRGMRVDKATLCAYSISYDAIFDSSGVVTESSVEFRQEILTMLESTKENLPNLSTAELHRAFFMATTMGQTPESEDAVDEPLSHFEAYIGAQHDDSPPPLDNSTEIIKDPPSEPDPDRYATRLEVMINRRLFITAGGRIGLGPARMGTNDVIVILLGGNVPYVLRPLKAGQWRFIGECYVHGFMKGEALQGDGANEEKHEWFELI